MADDTQLDIPDDVMNAARRIFTENMGMFWVDGGYSETECAAPIARAILAERLRCAKIALDKITNEQSEYGGGIDSASQRIHDQIMDGTA